MKNNDAKILAEMYENQILSEMVPFVPTGDLENLDRSKMPSDMQSLSSKFKGARGFHNLPEPVRKSAIEAMVTTIGSELAKVFAENDGRVEDNKKEFQDRIENMLYIAFGDRFQKSHYEHIARNTLNVIQNTLGAVKEVDKTRKVNPEREKRVKPQSAETWGDFLKND